MKGYTVNGTRMMVEVGREALDALVPFIDALGGDDAEVAEFRVYENLPVEVVIGRDYGFTTYVWDREGWVEA